ncbi:MAG: terpene cyclase/mutase family protein [Planctomycetaceae bacterium]|nr:terpene cyclase/mutase family protein [Planctomycetaceae bacterium]
MRTLLTAVVLCAGPADVLFAQQPSAPPASAIRYSVNKSLRLLESASAETAQQRKCFTCHGQALPAVVLEHATHRGFTIDATNLQRQLKHTFDHLQRSQERYRDGRGTGGQVDTAGWALWGLEAGQQTPHDVTDAVMTYLLGRQDDSGRWRCSSNRPPSEKSHFATTYLALRGLQTYGQEHDADDIARATTRARSWLEQTPPSDTEDRVFQLLSLPYVELNEQRERFTEKLIGLQRDDGGWAQKMDMDSDAYATATVLYALAEGGMESASPVYQRGLKFLTDNQQEDGSWHVKSRSKPFQTYFETGYPHGKDQFISMTAACWATLALLHALPDEQSSPASPDTQVHMSEFTDNFDTETRHGRLAERGAWQFENGIARCIADPTLYRKFKNHGPILKWPRKFRDGTIAFEMKARDCQRVVFTLNGDGHIFRVTLADEHPEATAGPSKVPTRLIAWATKSSKQNKGTTIRPAGLPDLPAVNEQWVAVRLKVQGTRGVLNIGDFRTEITHDALARDKTMVMLTFAYGELAVRRMKILSDGAAEEPQDRAQKRALNEKR